MYFPVPEKYKYWVLCLGNILNTCYEKKSVSEQEQNLDVGYLAAQSRVEKQY